MTSTTFNEYQQRTSRTAVYPEVGSGSAMALAYVGLGLGEVGEIQGKVKKILRDSGGIVTSEARVAILGEVGDALWYLARLCTELREPMGNVAQANLNKLSDRADRGVLGGSGDNR